MAKYVTSDTNGAAGLTPGGQADSWCIGLFGVEFPLVDRLSTRSSPKLVIFRAIWQNFQQVPTNNVPLHSGRRHLSYIFRVASNIHFN